MWIAGVEARRVISVGRVKWTVCYKVHIIASGTTEYKASVTLWPNPRKRLTSRGGAGWQPDLVKANWYQACGRQLRRHGYRGSWQWSPWGRFGDFWKPLKDLSSLVREAHKLDHLRNDPDFPTTASKITLQRTGPRSGR